MLKKLIIIFIVFLLSTSAAKQWVEVNSSDIIEPNFIHESDGLSSTEISFELSGYFL